MDTFVKFFFDKCARKDCKSMKCKKCQKDPCVCQEEEDKQYRFDQRMVANFPRRKEAMKQRRQQQREEKRKNETEK